MDDRPSSAAQASPQTGGVMVLAPGKGSYAHASGPRFGYRADPGFLAHLLAVRAHAPAQRSKCRAAPETGAAAYRSGLGLVAAAPAGRVAIRA